MTLLMGATLSGCSCVSEASVDECLASNLEQQKTIEAQQVQIKELTKVTNDQQIQIDDLTRQNSLDYSQLVFLRRTSKAHDTPSKAHDTPSANVTVTYPDAPWCEGGSMHWRVVLTETNGVGVTFTHGVYYHRTLEDGKWSEPQGVSYYDATNNWFAWPIRLPPNWQEECRTGDAGCFLDHRRYTWVYFGEDDNGHDIVAMGTIAVNEHN